MKTYDLDSSGHDPYTQGSIIESPMGGYYRVEDADAEIAELQRRLDAVVKMLEPTREMISDAQFDFRANHDVGVLMSLHSRAAAIAKGE